MRKQDQRTAGEHRDRCEIAQRVEGHAGDRWIHGDVADIGNQQRMAVRGGLRHERAADAATRTGAVIHDHVLSERFGELLCDQPSDCISAAAGCGGDHELQRALRIALRVGWVAGQRYCDCENDESKAGHEGHSG